MSADSEQLILRKLYALMDRQGAFRDDFPATPFVNSESEFGITMGPKSGGLYAMHHLIDSLSRSDFFEGKREPKTDLDTMAYTFGLGETKIYDAVIACRTQDEMSLTITTHHPVETILSALQSGIDAAQEKLDRRRKEAEKYAQMVRDEFSKENVGPLFNDATDIAFVKNYLKVKTDSYFSGNPTADVHGPLPAADYQSAIFSNYGITDTRPKFKISFLYAKKNSGPVNDFHNTVLRDVFTAPLAVFIDQTQKGFPRVELEVSGNPSRLARDIVKNDSDLAKKVLKSMGLRAHAGNIAATSPAVRRPKSPGGL